MERQRRKKNFPPSFDTSSIQGTIEAVEGHPIKLSLRVEGNPRPQVRWQVGRKRVKPSSKYRVGQDDQGTCTLVVNKSHKNLEEGVWAIATNDLGEDCCMIEVEVNEKGLLMLKVDFVSKPFFSNLLREKKPHETQIKN